MTEREKLESKAREAKVLGKTYPISRFFAHPAIDILYFPTAPITSALSLGRRYSYPKYVENEKGPASWMHHPGKHGLLGAGLGSIVGAPMGRVAFSSRAGVAMGTGIGALSGGAIAALAASLGRIIHRRATAGRVPGASMFSSPEETALGKKLRREDK